MIRRVAVLGGVVYAGKWIYDNFVRQSNAQVPLPAPGDPALRDDEIPPIGEPSDGPEPIRFRSVSVEP